MRRIIREAQPSDMAEIMQVMDAAKIIMRQSGNMHQWGDGYPSEAVITADMERNGGFVIEDGGKIVGYFAFLPSPELTYAKIYEGKWINVSCIPPFYPYSSPCVAPMHLLSLSAICPVLVRYMSAFIPYKYRT